MKTFEMAFDFEVIPAVCVLQNFSNSSFAKPTINILWNMLL